MKITNKFFILLCLLILKSECLLAIDWSNVQNIKTKRGLQISFVENHDLPIVSMNFLLKGGGYATEDVPGVTQLMARLLNDRATVGDSESLYNQIEQDGIVMQFSVDIDSTKVYIKAVSSKFLQAIDYFNSLIYENNISDDALIRAKREMESEYRVLEENPYFILSRRTFDFAFKGHPCSKNPYGSLEEIQSISASDVKKRINDVFNIADLRIAISGDIDSNKLTTEFDQRLNSFYITSGSQKISKPSLQKSDKLMHFDYDIPQTVIAFYSAGVSISDPRFYTASVLSNLLGGGLPSILYKEVRIKKGLVYSINFGISEKIYYTLFFGQSATKYPQETINVIKDVLESVSTKGVSEEDIADVKSYMMNKFVMSLIDSRTIVNLLSNLQLFDVSADFLTNYKNNISIVTLNDVNSFARYFMKPENFTFLTIGK